MKIKMLQTVEDSHLFLVENEGKAQTLYDVRKFYQGEEVDHTDVYPGWDRRAKKLIGYGYAEEVKQ